jgi:hypothetical protein
LAELSARRISGSAREFESLSDAVRLLQTVCTIRIVPSILGAFAREEAVRRP